MSTPSTTECPNVGYHRDGWTCRECGKTEGDDRCYGDEVGNAEVAPVEWLSMEWMRHDGGIHLQELLSLIDSVNFYLTDSKAKDADKQALKRIKKLRAFLNQESP